MGDLEPKRPRNLSVAIDPAVNPEGKGLNGFLLDWHGSQPRGVAVKQERQILAEYFTSMLILSAAFKFKPVVGQVYYLYWIDNEWSLSLIGPHEWTTERASAYAGQCALHDDMTWTIEVTDKLKNHSSVSDAIGDFYRSFIDKLNNDQSLEADLPFHVKELNYYQRLYASAMSRSIKRSVRYGQQANRTSREWLEHLPSQVNALLLGNK